MEYGNDSIIQADAIVDHYVHTSFGIERGSMNMREYCEKNIFNRYQVELKGEPMVRN